LINTGCSTIFVSFINSEFILSYKPLKFARVGHDILKTSDRLGWIGVLVTSLSNYNFFISSVIVIVIIVKKNLLFLSFFIGMCNRWYFFHWLPNHLLFLFLFFKLLMILFLLILMLKEYCRMMLILHVCEGRTSMSIIISNLPYIWDN